jgi:hypothetical protein
MREDFRPTPSTTFRSIAMALNGEQTGSIEENITCIDFVDTLWDQKALRKV